jgi:vancomycin resistance protein YoaR
VIVADEVEPGVGGGVCQVASTLFAAGVLGGLDVVKRRSHSRPSGYAPLGLDATVIDGEVDLQLRNPYPVPIIVHAFLPVPTRIRVEMLGTAAPGKVEHTYAVTKSEDFFRKVARHPELRRIRSSASKRASRATTSSAPSARVTWTAASACAITTDLLSGARGLLGRSRRRPRELAGPA